jgi:hypothetical protein
MIAEAITKLNELIHTAETPFWLPREENVRKALLVEDGKVKEYELEAETENFEAESLEAFVGMVAAESVAPARITHNHNAVSCWRDENARELGGMIRLGLAPSAPFCRLVNIEAACNSPQMLVEQRTAPNLWKELKYTFPNGGVDTILEGLQTIQWRGSSGADQAVSHGQSTLGRQVEDKVVDTAKLQEFFDLNVQVYMTPGIRTRYSRVPCYLHLDVAQCLVEFGVMPNGTDVAIEDAQNVLHARLCELLKKEELEEIPVFYGC